MSFPRYEKCKDSAVEWLGEVPAHWRVVRVRWLCEIKKRIVGELGFDVLSITQKGIRIKDTESNDGQISMDYSKYQLVEVGDFAMNHMDLLTGFVDRSSVVGVTSPDYRVFSIRDTNVSDEGFVLYLFQNGYINRVFFPFGQGSSQFGRWRLPTEQFNDFWLPVPPLGEQHAIATFLDHETAKIDALVEEQKRLIELLKEKRQAVISHAVTKGLNPNAPMKDSGVEWLGGVPAHWIVAPIKTFGWLKGGAGFPHKEQGVYGEELNFYKVASLGSGSSGVIDQAEHTISRSTAEHLGAYVFPGGTLVFAKVGAALLLGRVRLLAADACIDNNMMGVVPHESTVGEFLRLAMSLVRFDLIANPGAVPSLNEGQIGDFPLVKPPTKEQRAIAALLIDETARIDSLTFEAQRGVELLQERRTALISAAVTGKIDVRRAAAEASV